MGLHKEAVIVWDLASGTDCHCRLLRLRPGGLQTQRCFHPFTLVNGDDDCLTVTHRTRRTGQPWDRLFRLAAPDVAVADWPGTRTFRLARFGLHAVVGEGSTEEDGSVRLRVYDPRRGLDSPARAIDFPPGLWHPERSVMCPRDDGDGYYVHDYDTGVSKDVGFTRRSNVGGGGGGDTN